MSDELTLEVSGREISGWDQVRVTRSTEHLPSDFSLSLMDYYPGSGEKQLVTPGEACVVRLGNDPVVTGYIDRWSSAIGPSRHEVHASGRGKCQDLVDCSAIWPNNVIENATPLQIAQKLAAPYGIRVGTDVTDLQNVPQFSLNWGESSQEVIDRMMRWAALLYYDLPDGSLFLTRVSTRKAASGVAVGQNIQAAWYDSSCDGRYSDYTGISMPTTAVTEISPGDGYASVTLATAADPEMAAMRYRNLVTLIESTLNTYGAAQQYINWEMNRRFGRSRVLHVTVDSWRDTDGKLWEPNTLIPVTAPQLNLDNDAWLLGEITFQKDERGTTAEMVLMPPQAFMVEPYQFYSNIMELNYK
ncbi:phage baseplate assembly protein [Enterobacter ludwigii]|jgi:prophage tail gpP-like protein|uniref:phage baseplate assembly protein n=1 Tax=Enterobacter ludwigii TaxID=299767 RepID=UPI0003D88D9B|nr:contractile injection system protein, VgrG/Pvc8 family [Enterobacter ludwigii]AHE72797.1 hypothetical protein M942_08665 [Enterobacter ludwigii]